MNAVTEVFGDHSVNLSLFGHNMGNKILKSLLTKKSVRNVSKLYLTYIDISKCKKINSDLRAKLVYDKSNSERCSNAWDIKFLKMVSCKYSFNEWNLPKVNTLGENIEYVSSLKKVITIDSFITFFSKSLFNNIKLSIINTELTPASDYLFFKSPSGLHGNTGQVSNPIIQYYICHISFDQYSCINGKVFNCGADYKMQVKKNSIMNSLSF